MSPEGEVLLTLGTKGEPAPPMSGRPLCRPTHLAVDRRNGDLFVSDGYSNARVHHYTPDGELVGSWGESGTGPGQMNIVHNIAIDDEGWIYVADRENRRIQVFDTEGNLEAQWANLSRAATVCVDHQGLVYVGEYYAGIGSNVLGTDLGPRVTIFDTQGNVQAKLGRESYGDQPGRFLRSPRHLRRLQGRHLRRRGLLGRVRDAHGPAQGAQVAPEVGEGRIE